ncbi:MAG TPA: hypothetical protein VNJ01_05370 [Bacteriovoracaceae bacterium]|nr:hypothetical protein [Bacteriovoracaceae bacterium]
MKTSEDLEKIQLYLPEGFGGIKIVEMSDQSMQLYAQAADQLDVAGSAYDFETQRFFGFGMT